MWCFLRVEGSLLCPAFCSLKKWPDFKTGGLRTLSYRRIPRTEVAYTNYLTNSLNIFIDKTLVFSSNVLFTYLFIDKKPYYNGSLSLNKSIDLTSIGL